MSDTASTPVLTYSDMITFAISAEHSPLQLNSAFFFSNPKKKSNDIYGLCGNVEL